MNPVKSSSLVVYIGKCNMLVSICVLLDNAGVCGSRKFEVFIFKLERNKYFCEFPLLCVSVP